MAIVFMDGFDYYTQAQSASQRGWSATISSMQTGRNGSGQAIRMNNGATAAGRALPSSYATLFFGFAFRVQVGSFALADIFQLKTGGSGGTNVFRVGLDATGKIVVRNSGGTIVATGTTILLQNVWYYIEGKAFVNGASGTCEIHLNGVAGEIASTVGNFGSSNMDAVVIQAGTNPNCDFDDMYVCDTTGSARNTFLGDQVIETLYASGSGNSSAWTASTGTAATCIDEAQANGDTDYISSSTVNNVSTFAFGDLSVSSGNVNGVQANHYVRKDDVAARQIANVIREGGTDYVGTTQPALSTTYTIQSQLYDKDPTPADWTISNVNAAEFGVKQIA